MSLRRSQPLLPIPVKISHSDKIAIASSVVLPQASSVA